MGAGIGLIVPDVAAATSPNADFMTAPDVIARYDPRTRRRLVESHGNVRDC
jgi:hypothetical protein